MRISQDYIDASGEVDEILNYMSKEDYNKIPEKLKGFFKKIKSDEYIPHIDLNTPLKKQEINDKTKLLLAFIYRKYLCDESEKQIFDEKLKENDIKYKEFIESSYEKDVEEIFKEINK